MACGAVGIVRGALPEWANGYGSGYGSGSGYGYGDGYGYGSGYGSGSGAPDYCAAAFRQYRKVEQLPDGRFILFKSVKPKDGTDFYTGKIKYEGVVECPDWDPDPKKECGNGLHVSPTAEDALNYNKGRVLRVAAHPDDIAVYWKNMTKVRCRRVEVLGPVDEVLP